VILEEAYYNVHAIKSQDLIIKGRRIDIPVLDFLPLFVQNLFSNTVVNMCESDIELFSFHMFVIGL
jgi:hypothetical protein